MSEVYELSAGYELHPEGTFQGRIVEVEDEGVVDTRFGPKERLIIKLESSTAWRENGELHTLWIWVTKSGSSKSKLTKLRAQLLGRPLTDAERRRFETAEMVGKTIQYTVIHDTDGEKSYAGLAAWKASSSGATPDQRPAPARPAPASRPAPEDDGPPPFADGDLPVRYIEADSNSDLPF